MAMSPEEDVVDVAPIDLLSLNPGGKQGTAEVCPALGLLCMHPSAESQEAKGIAMQMCTRLGVHLHESLMIL